MVRLRLLGETAIDVDGTPVGPESQVLFAVLLVLALERGKRIARPALHRLLWPDADEDSGRHNLRQVLYKLRQLGAPLDATQSSVMLPVADVTGELVELTSDPGAIGARLLAGRRVGDLLPGYAPGFSAAFADWVEEQRALLHAQLRRALLGALAEARTLGQWREVEAIAREVLRFDPLNEEATLALAESTALAGAKAQAIGIIDRYLDEIGGRGADLRVPATVLRRRIAERFPAHRYVSAADACFVGRATEMADLLRLWHRARERRGGAALLWGEPGIGKTRLAHELGRVAVLQGAQVQRVASRSWDVHRPLGAIVDLVPLLRELPGAAGIDPRCHEYLDRLTKHDPARALADLPDPATLHREVRQAVFDLVDALLAEAPLVLVFEDVQWLDASSWEVVAELLRLARTRRLLLVLTSRVLEPPHLPESEDWEALRRLRVGGLDPAATHELLDAMTREAGRYIDPEYREWCLPLANGNPLHVQEIALQWLEKGSVREAPGSLRAMVEARVTRLSHVTRTVLQLSCVMGSHISLEAYPLTGLFTARELLQATAELARLRLVAVNGDELAAIHPLVEEIALAHLSVGELQILYRTAARTLEELAPTAKNINALWSAAHLWTKAGEAERAVSSIVRCANHLVLVGLPSVAVELYERTESLALPDHLRTVLSSEKALALAHADRWQQVVELLNGERPRTTSGAHAASGPALLLLLEARWRQHEIVDPIIADAVLLARSRMYDGTTRLRSATLAVMLADNRDGSLAEYELCRDDIRRLLQDHNVPALERYRHLMILHAVQCQPEASARSAALMLRAVSNGDPPHQSVPYRQAALAFRFGGRLDDAERALRAALDLVRGEASISSQAQCYVALAHLALYRHQVEEGGYWCALAASIPAFAQNPLASHEREYTMAQLAAARGDEAELRSLVPRLGDPFAVVGNARRELACVGAALRAEAFAGTRLSARGRALLELCLTLLNKHQHRGQADFAVAAAVRALRCEGLVAHSHELVRNYTSVHRLERCPLHIDLRRLTEEDAESFGPGGGEQLSTPSSGSA